MLYADNQDVLHTTLTLTINQVIHTSFTGGVSENGNTWYYDCMNHYIPR